MTTCACFYIINIRTYGHCQYGPRYLIPVIPFLICVIICGAFQYLSNVLPPHKNVPSQPTSEIISIIEGSGRDANCADIIGKWFLLDLRDNWEFQAIGRFTATRTFWERVWGRYTCDDTNRTVEIPYFGLDEYPSEMILHLGSILDDWMIIYSSKDKSNPRILVRDTGNSD